MALWLYRRLNWSFNIIPVTLARLRDPDSPLHCDHIVHLVLGIPPEIRGLCNRMWITDYFVPLIRVIECDFFILLELFALVENIL